jgi:hypothetical protein
LVSDFSQGFVLILGKCRDANIIHSTYKEAPMKHSISVLAVIAVLAMLCLYAHGFFDGLVSLPHP